MRLAEQDLPVRQAQLGQLDRLDRKVPLDLQDRVLMADRNSRPPALFSCRLAPAGSVWNSMAPAVAEPLSTAMEEAAEAAEPTRVRS